MAHVPLPFGVKADGGKLLPLFIVGLERVREERLSNSGDAARFIGRRAFPGGAPLAGPFGISATNLR